MQATCPVFRNARKPRLQRTFQREGVPMAVTARGIRQTRARPPMHLRRAGAHRWRAPAQSSPDSSWPSSIAARRLRPVDPEASITIVAIRSQMPITAV